jgi:alpha-ketoglutarate-dependent taurine dioxygenase
MDMFAMDRSSIEDALITYGVLLFRGFDISSVDGFKAFADALSGRGLMSYAGGVSPRSTFGDRIYNSTEYPADMVLRLHNEMSYSSVFPRFVYFWCEIEPASGGETTLGDGRQIIDMIGRDVVEEFESRRGVRYERYLVNDGSSPYSWQAAFETCDPQRVERLCSEMSAEFEWDQTGAVSIFQVGPATTVHPVTGDRVWFNQADGFHHTEIDDETLESMRAAGMRPRLGSTFGDGTAIDRRNLDHIREVKQRATYAHRWKAGDVLALDNIRVMHGRNPFSGPRKIAVAMC